MKYIIQRVNPLWKCALKKVYEYLMVECCDSYPDLTLNQFLECRDSVFIAYEPAKSIWNMTKIYGVIGCKKTCLDKTSVEKLAFYPMIDKGVYDVQFFHMSDSVDEADRQSMALGLLQNCIADKNDGFTVTKITCNVILNSGLEDALTEMIKTKRLAPYGARIERAEGALICIMPPAMHIND